MKQCQKFVASLVLVTLCAGAGLAAESWTSDFTAAKAEAKKAGRPILADFTGSDWCPWCIKLEREVFSQAAFQEYAKENLVLFLADFPRKKTLSSKVVKQNQSLQTKYQVEGYPTVLLLDADGKVLGQTGYQPGGPEVYVASVKALLSKAGWKPAANAGGSNAAPGTAAAPTAAPATK